MKTPSAAAQLNGFLAKFTPEIAGLVRALLAKFRRLVPPSFELVYDNYNFLVVGFSPTERPSDAVFSVALYARGIGLCFLRGAVLPDPHRLLIGGGKQVRTLRLPSVDVLDDPRVRDLIARAIRDAPAAYPPGLRRRLIIKSISAKQRPRRPNPKTRR